MDPPYEFGSPGAQSLHDTALPDAHIHVPSTAASLAPIHRQLPPQLQSVSEKTPFWSTHALVAALYEMPAHSSG